MQCQWGAAVVGGVYESGLWFSCGAVQCGGALISIFQRFSASVGGILGLGGGGGWALGYNSMGF